MRYPPAIRYTPVRSGVYLLVAVLIATILIALCAYFMPANGHFSLKKGFFVVVAAWVCLWLLHDAWKRPLGQLHYAQGQWVWQQGGQNIAGTCALHLDLQSYLLVSFVAQHSRNSLLFKTTQWFHLEARRVDPMTWGKLRRAVHAQVEPSHEAVAL
jgi:hypothetical protein